MSALSTNRFYIRLPHGPLLSLIAFVALAASCLQASIGSVIALAAAVA